METISTRAAEAFAGGGGIATTYAEVWHKTQGKTATLELLGAVCTFDTAASFPRSVRVQLAGFDAIVPENSEVGYEGTMADTDGEMGDGIFGDRRAATLNGLLTPGPNQLRLFLRLLFPDGTHETINMGRYDISHSGFNHSAAGGLITNVTGYDVTRQVLKAGYSAPYNINPGTNVRTALINHLTSRVPGLSVSVPSTEFTTPGITFLPIEGMDVLSDAQEIAYSGGWVLDSTRTGGMVAAAPKDPGSGTAVWHTDEAVIISLDSDLDDDSAVNRLVINGQDADSGREYYGSASYTEGPWGTTQLGVRTKVETSEFIISNAHASLVASTKLPQYLGFVDRMTVSVPFAPHLDHGDLISITDETLNLDEQVYLLELVEHDLGEFKSMLTVSRRLV